METICQGMTFSSKISSGNLKRVEFIAQSDAANSNSQDGHFQLWLNKDCEGTPFETNNRTWFYFSISGYEPSERISLKIMNMQNQTKLFQLGHVPMARDLPAKCSWERIKSNVDFKPSNEGFSLSFSYTFPPEVNSCTEFAFTYPWTYEEEQNFFAKLDSFYESHQSIYYHREVLCYSLGGNRVDLITISAPNAIKKTREKRFNWRLFDSKFPRCAAFNKKVVLLSARVHPGETPGSLVLLGLIHFLLSKEKSAVKLRKEFVFKIVPMVNPDGVLAGNYRMDCLGVNLNRVYNNPDPLVHPTIYAVKSLAIYHHIANSLIPNVGKLLQKVFPPQNPADEMELFNSSSEHLNQPELLNIPPNESGIAFYIDFHGHVSKRGCFIYGNYFKDEKIQIDNMMMAKLIAINCRHFDMESCNFSERMMNCNDIRGQSRQGSARVSLYHSLGIIHSYTFECNYNTNRIGNEFPSVLGENSQKLTKYDFSQIGREIGISLLDYFGINPCSRLPVSKYRNLGGVKLCLSKYVSAQRKQVTDKKNKSKNRVFLEEELEFSEPARKSRSLSSDAALGKTNLENKQSLSRKTMPSLSLKVKKQNHKIQIPIPVPSVWPFKTFVSKKRKPKNNMWLKVTNLNPLERIGENTKIEKLSGVAFFVKI